jgi:hypothetical protein
MAVSSANPGYSGIRKCVTLTSGTSYTVPEGVTFLNVKRVGAEASSSHVGYSTNGVSGGATTFTGLTDAAGGLYFPQSYASGNSPTYPRSGPDTLEDTITVTPGASITYAIGASTSGGTGSYSARNGYIFIEYWV